MELSMPEFMADRSPYAPQRRRVTRFRPCIDLHSGSVKQIVGGTLTKSEADLKTNFVSKRSAAHFARLYRRNKLVGAHIIKLGPGNDDAAKEALREWPNTLQIGGGIDESNAAEWIEAGASKVIVTSYLFPKGRFEIGRLKAILAALKGDKQRLVVDLSCRRNEDKWVVAMNKWQTLTDMELSKESIQLLEPYCSEFLVHAADNEGLQRGVDMELVGRLAEWCTIPVTYAGGAKSLEDLEFVDRSSNGRVDLTIGSALDIFGGKVMLEECVRWNSRIKD